MDHKQKVARAEQLMAAANKELGGTFLQLADDLNIVTLGELMALARSKPGSYMAVNIFRLCKHRAPTRGEAIRLGHLLAALRIPRRTEAGTTLWQLSATALGA